MAAGSEDPRALISTAMELFSIYQDTGSEYLLNRSVELFRQAARATGDGYQHGHVYLHNLGYALSELFGRTGDTAVLTELIRVCREAVAAAPDNYADRVQVMNNLAASLRQGYEHTGDVALLTESVRIARANASGADWHPDGAFLLSNLGESLELLCERTGDAAVLDEWVRESARAVERSADDSLRQAASLNSLANALAARFERTGDMAALGEAVQASRKAVAANPDEALYLMNLGERLRLLFERTGDVAVLTEAVRVVRQATAAPDPVTAARWNTVTAVLLTLARRTGRIEDLREAVEAARQTVAAAGPAVSGRAGYLANLAGGLGELYEHTGDSALLMESVRYARQSVAAAPAGHPLRALSLTALLNALGLLFESTGDTAALDESARAAADALAATPRDHPHRAARLANLATTLESLYERSGDTTFLTRAVQACREAVAATPDDDPVLAVNQHTLGNTLHLLYQRSGDTAVLAEAVDVHREALDRTPADHPDLADWLGGLETALRSLYASTGESAVLAEAVQIARQAADATPAGHIDRFARLLHLGGVLRSLAQRTHDDTMLAESVQLTREGLAQLPPGHPGRAAFLSSLANGLLALSGRTGDTALPTEALPTEALLTEAVRSMREAIAATSAGDIYRAGQLHDLGGILRRLYGETADTSVLAEAVRVAGDAVAATPADDPDHATYLDGLGLCLAAQSESTKDLGPMAEAWQCFVQAARNTSAPAARRIWAYRRAAEAGERIGRPAAEVLALVESAVELLAQVAPRTLARADREESLGRMLHLAGQAAAAAVQAGRPERAVELLEQTRGVLVADRLDALSSDLAGLSRREPDLAREFRAVRDRIDAIDNARDDAQSALDEEDQAAQAGREQARARQRRQAYAALDGVIARIRAIEGFAGFLKPPDVLKLASYAAEGPVVFVYASLTRCDALILFGQQDPPVRLVPLAFPEDDAYRQINRLHDALRAPPGRAAQAEVLDVLAWEWDTIAEPVLAALGHTGAPAGQRWPRIWWCPVGAIAYLPLHAAGHHRDVTAHSPASARTVMDRVVSSYVTTARGLGYARGQQAAAAADDPLIVAVPDAPELEELNGVRIEAATVSRLFPGARVLPHPTRETVLAELPAHRLVHFSCHGYADWDDPSASLIALYDHRTAPLTVAEISALRLTGGLAYLSACETASTGFALTNEAIHLTGAFHLAGYRHVVGTMWPILDRASADITSGFYRYLTSDGTTRPDLSLTSRSLHQAIREFRDAHSGTPTLWAAHTHTGT